MNDVKLKIGAFTEIVADRDTLSKIMSLLINTTDEKGEQTVVLLEGFEGVESYKMKQEAQRLADEAMERENKRWYEQYNRANDAERELCKLRELVRESGNE